MMHGHEKSDSAIVAVKPANKVERSAAEPVEPRAETKGNVGQQSTRRTQSRISVSKALARIRQIVAVDTRGGSRMRESRTYGSVRGARGNSRPYRDIQFAALHESGCGIVSRVTPVHTALRNCTRDEGRPFEVGNQVLISSHRKLLSSKAMVVNVAEKSERDFGRYD